jgi:hypothetical protein
MSIDQSQLPTTPYPPSIAISRSQARRLLESCELEEISLPIAPAASDGEEKSKSSAYVLVIEMALLIHLGDYVHAHHLWERSRHNSSDPTPENGEKSEDDTAHTQLEMLWNAARYCYLWSTGGLYPLNDMSKAPSNTMQVEDTEDKTNLPYSALALQALQSCVSSGMQPASIYAVELVDIFRFKVNEALHRSFAKIKADEFSIRMNGEKDVNKYGWIVSSEYLMPDSEWEPRYQDLDVDDGVVGDSQFVPQWKHDDIMVHQLLSNGDRIGQLMKTAMFMEQAKMNA